MSKMSKFAVAMVVGASLLGSQAFAQGGSKIGRDNFQKVTNHGRVIVAAIGSESKAIVDQAVVRNSKIGRDNHQEVENKKDVIVASIGSKTEASLKQAVVE